MPFQRLRQHLVVLGVVSLLVLATGPGVVAAQSMDATQEMRLSGTAVVEEGVTVNGLDVVSGTVVVRGTVDGDLSGVAGNVVIADTGVVTGDVSVATGSLDIAGTVEGSVSAGTGSAILAETGSVGEDFQVGAGTVTIDGVISGDATAGGDTITLGSTAEIGGELRYDGVLTQQSGSVVGGPIVEDDSIGGYGPVGVSGVSLPSIGWLDTVYGLLANLLLGAVLLLVLPEFSNRVARRGAERTGRSALVGLLLLIGVPIGLILVAITVVGIPLALFGMFVFAFAVWSGVVYGEYTAGRWLVGRFQNEPSRWVALGLGLVLFSILGALPMVGGLFTFAATLVGFGALGSTLRGSYSRWRGNGPSRTTATEDSDTAPA